MHRLWKWATAFVVVVPVTAYVLGTLAAADPRPTPREPIVIRMDTEDDRSAEREGRGSGDRSGRERAEPTRDPVQQSPSPTTTREPDDPAVVTPSPRQADDDDEDDEDDDEVSENGGDGDEDDEDDEDDD